MKAKRRKKYRLFRQVFQENPIGARAENGDDEGDAAHRDGEKGEDGADTAARKDGGDQDGRKCGAEAAPAVGEADGGGANARGEELRLIGVESGGEPIIRESEERAEGDDGDGCACSAELLVQIGRAHV